MDPAATLLQARLPHTPRLSPDGARIAFALTEYSAKRDAYTKNLWIMDADGSNMRPLTRGSGSLGTPHWSPDGRYLAYTARTAESCLPQLWLMPMQGGEPFALTRSPMPVHAPCWAPDGSRLLFLSPDGPTEEEVLLEAKGGIRRVGAAHHTNQIWTVETASGRMRRLTRDRSAKGRPCFSPDGALIAFERRADSTCNQDYRSSVWVMGSDGKGRRRLSPPQGCAMRPCFSPDSAHLAFLYRDRPLYAYPDRLAVAPVSGGEPVFPTQAMDRPVIEAAWTQPGRIHFLLQDGLRRHLYSVGRDGRRLEQLTKGDRTLGDLHAAGRRLVYVSGDATGPGQIHLAAARSEKTLTDFNPGLSNGMGETRAVRWKGADGLPIEGLLVLPARRRSRGPLPLVVEPHGGPANSRTFSFFPMWQLLASLGYAILAPNFRGSSGYGRNFVLANTDDFGGGDFSDVMAGVDYLIDEGIADPKRLGIMGYSYGGFMTGWAIGHTDRFRAAVAGAGVHNLHSFFGTTDIQWFTEHYQKGLPWQRPEAYTKQSPVAHAGKIKTPTLVYHGDEDRRVPLEQSEQLYMALKHRRVPTEFVRYPRAGHGLGEYAHKLDYAERLVRWFDKYVLGKTK